MNEEKIKKIAVVVSTLDEEYQYNIIKGINKFASEHNLNLSYFAAFGGVIGSQRFDIGEYRIYDLINYSKFDGIILMINTFGTAELRTKILEQVKAAHKPTVIFESREVPEFYDISMDNYSVMKELVNHIIQHHGAKVLNCVTGPLENPEAKARYDAFCDAMHENGLEIEEERVYYGNFGSYAGKLAVKEFMATNLPLPNAIICANDSMALTVVSSLEKLGYKIPDDVMVTGFDNTFYAQNTCPALTTVKRNLDEVGYNSCQILFNVINGREAGRHTVVNGSPIYSESCGCSVSDSSDPREYKISTYRKIERNNIFIHALNRLTAALAETETITSIKELLEPCVDDLEMDRFSLCLIKNWQEIYATSSSSNDGFGYSSYMTSPFICDKGSRRSVSLFPSSDMYPEGFKEESEINYFLPLHFSERFLGYYIITNSEFPTASLLCHTLSMALSNCIENIRKLYHLNKAMDELNRLYVIDPLCNIYNRNGFIKVADDMYKECYAEKRPIMISFIDMDGLKMINDNYGHLEGDFAIQRLAGVVRECCGSRSICARFGGDEFVIFSTDAMENAASSLSMLINASLDNINNIVKKPYLISASIGSIITVPTDSDTLSSIIKQADEKMYEIKKLKKKERRN